MASIFAVVMSGTSFVNKVEGADCIGRSAFGNHAFGLLGNDVFDACAGPVCGKDFGQYVNSVIDTSTPEEASVASGGHVYHKGDNYPIKVYPFVKAVTGVADLK